MNEFLRKMSHLVFGLIIVGGIIALPEPIMVYLLLLSIFAGFIISDAIQRGYYIPFISGLIDRLERKDAIPGKGAIYFAISCLFCLIFFEKSIVVPAIAALAILDGIATIVGLRFGRNRIYNGKSLEGSFAGMVATLLALLFLLPPVQAFAASFVAGVVEILSPVDDNLTIPVAVCLLLLIISVG
ncbi:MAG: phosphatidate cytidylyltransferase [Methanoregulaceae archaeon]|mgnify:CR=1 FL=1|nr:phosphatidate cytidylyltransferase [Methanoregulaceae archaeon]HRX33159.1 phosphatidate cytidylyltransferase [Methanoregulaceae archaeon]